MPGIADLTVDNFQYLVNRFDQKYVDDWSTWLNTPDDERPDQLGATLRRWQACRPNTMRRTRKEKSHSAPFLEDLIAEALPYIRELTPFSIREKASFSDENLVALSELWNVFQHLPYKGKARDGKAGVVGISKAVLLLSDGRVGPAFDSEVRGHLDTGNIDNAEQWINALCRANRDIVSFEQANDKTICDCAPPEYASLHAGRIYDMALGPGS